MLIVFAALIGLGLACINLPEPMVSHLASGIVEVSFEDVPGTQFREIAYSNNENMESSEVGQLHQAADGRWYHRNNSAVQIDGQPFYYKVSALMNGKKVDYSGVVSSENTMALAPLQRVSKRGTVILRDNFDGSALNQEEWEHEVTMNGGYNWEFQVYTNDSLNVFQRDGKLYLKPTLTSDKFGEEFLTNGKMDVREIWGTCTNSDRYGCVREGKYGLLPPIMSGRVKSKKTIKFGRVDVRAKIPKGDWIWPAIWLLPRSYLYGGWPASGEIDMMESRGNLRAMGGTKNHGNCEVCSTVHLGPEPSQHRYQGTQGAKYDPTPGWSQEFHTYTLDWDADRIICSVDNDTVLTVPTPAEGFWNYGPPFSGSNPWVNGGKSAPYDEPFYLILNVAVGGTNNFFPDDWSYNTPKPWRNNSTTANADFWKKRNDWLPTWNADDVAMQIDYVEMTQY